MRNKEKCQGEFQLKFLEKCHSVHGNRFNYSAVEYVNNRTPVIIKCNHCDTIFSPIPFNFLKQKNCPACAITTQRKDTSEFIVLAKEIHGDNYDYTFTKYTNAKTKVEIKCNMCNTIFSQLPRGHIYEKSGCPICRQSHGEEKISLLLKLMNIPFIPEHKFSDCVSKLKIPLRFDFYLPQSNMCIEFDGRQHSDKTSKYWTPSVEENDRIKTNYCLTSNISLKRISYTDIKNIEAVLLKFLF